MASHRNRAYLSQDQRCYYCRVLMYLDDLVAFASRYGLTQSQARQLECTAEHRIARKDGGTDRAENIAAACWYCNQQRHRRKRPLSSNDYRKIVANKMQLRRWHPRWVYDRGLIHRSIAPGQ